MDTLQQIKDKLDIVEFLRPYLTLSPAGKNFKANCPFHKEKTPSFIVSPEKQIWHCFGCHLGGDAIGFLMRYENLEFVEALKVLAEKAGLDLRNIGTGDQKKFNILYEINSAAKDFYKSNLPASEIAKNYLVDRGLKAETIAEFEIGFAPDGYDALTKFLIGKGYNIADIERAGLAFKTDRGTYMDRFRNRIMFPLQNHFGKTIGFTGRVLPGETADVGKYVNSPETPIFNKSKLLFGLHKSKHAIRDSRSAVLVEGQMDFLMSWQDGVKNLTATSGTALTIDHLKTLKRIADTLILSFDQDEAGRHATERTIDLAGASDFSVKIVANKGLKDPADVVKEHPGLMKSLIEQAQPAMRYYFERYAGGESLDSGKLKNNLRTVLTKIKSVYSSVEKSFWLKELSSLTGVEERYLGEEMENLKGPETAGVIIEESGLAPSQEFSRKELIGQRIASLILAKNNFYNSPDFEFGYLPENHRLVLASALAGKPLPGPLKQLADTLTLRSSFDSDLDDEKAKKELQELFRQLKTQNLKERRQEIQLTVQQAEKSGNDQQLIQNLSEFDRVSKEIQNLEQQQK